jgi:hypothetical protein
LSTPAVPFAARPWISARTTTATTADATGARVVQGGRLVCKPLSKKSWISFSALAQPVAGPNAAKPHPACAQLTLHRRLHGNFQQVESPPNRSLGTWANVLYEPLARGTRFFFLRTLHFARFRTHPACKAEWLRARLVDPASSCNLQPPMHYMADIGQTRSLHFAPTLFSTVLPSTVAIPWPKFFFL